MLPALCVRLSSQVLRSNVDGSWDYLKWAQAATFLRADKPPARPAGANGYDLAILVSPDYELDANRRILAALAPRHVLAIVHNADLPSLSQVVGMHRSIEIVALAPHVAAALQAATQRPANWLLSVYPVEQPCQQPQAPGYLGSCLHGFTLQGGFSNLRRNYSAMWEQLRAHKAQVRGKARCCQHQRCSPQGSSHWAPHCTASHPAAPAKRRLAAQQGKHCPYHRLLCCAPALLPLLANVPAPLLAGG